MRYRVTAPIEGYAGDVVGVRFTGGRAVVDARTQRAALQYFQRHDAYEVAPVDEDQDDGGRAEDGPQRPPGNASRADWAAYAAAIGIDAAAIEAAERRGDVVALVDAHESEDEQG